MGLDVLWVLPLGLVVGLSLGALGGGGAILTVPIFVYLLHQPPSAGTTGSLVIVALTSLAGMVRHRRDGNVRVRQGLVFGLVGIVGSVIGSHLSAAISPAVLMTAFAVLMLAVAVVMFRRRSSPSRGGPSGGERRGVGVLVATASAVGFLTGFFGVGGGFAVVPGLVLALGFTMPVAVGTSLLVIVINSLTALASRIVTGTQVDWPLILAFSAFGALGSVLGGRIASRVDPRHLSLAFSVLLIGVAGYVLVKNLPGLVAG